jgi:membrane glycosyltransferase
MEAMPGCGLLQTIPSIIRSQTLFARLQQFANRCYGPIFGNGLGAWHGWSSNFWGHNAIIRTAAFAASARLPILTGQPPFGGSILSHDFIEAALLRRAGWGVHLATDIEHTYEEAPPSLTDVLVRDRRWCQGNLQHSRLLLAQGLTPATRLHLLTGILAYLSAAFWFALVVVGLAIAIQAALTMPDYFDGDSFLPNWPVFDVERAINLFMVSMGVLLVPKVLGWLAVMIQVRRCMRFGGPLFFTLSVLVEIIFSALFAPVMMFGQTTIVRQILMGEDSGWKPQRRDDGSITFKAAMHLHFWHVTVGLTMTIIARDLNPDLFWWLLPVTGGLMAAPFLAMVSGSRPLGLALKKLRIFQTPEERVPPPILLRMESCQLEEDNFSVKSALSHLLSDVDLLRWHCDQLPATRHRDRQPAFDPGLILAEAKMERSRSVLELEQTLTAQELTALLHSSVRLRVLARSRRHEQIQLRNAALPLCPTAS